VIHTQWSCADSFLASVEMETINVQSLQSDESIMFLHSCLFYCNGRLVSGIEFCDCAFLT